MEFTISKLAKLAGVSSRTLRYYDEIDLLKPSRLTRSGYRIYGQKEIDRLQQILFFRELEVSLETIIQIMNEPHFDQMTALLHHHNKLVQKRARLDKLIETIDRTISHQKGECIMSNEEKFKIFKADLITENEQKFGEEIREKYSDKTVDESNAKLRGLSKENFETMEKLGKEILELLPKAYKTSDPSSDLAQKLAAKHKEWLTYSWPTYSKEAHKGLAEMYAADERFKAYYDKAIKGGTEFLRDAIIRYVDKQ